MTKEQLIKGKELGELIKYHDEQSLYLEKRATELERYLSVKYIRELSEYKLNGSGVVEMKPNEVEENGEKVLKWECVTLKNSGYVGIGSVNIRPKALVSYLRIEAQYHDQEAKKYGRELKRL